MRTLITGTIVLVIIFSHAAAGVVQIICENHGGTIQCSTGKVIVITYANYGRTFPRGKQNCWGQSGVCYSNQYCKVSKACNLKNSCHLVATNSVYGDPCVGTYKFLEIHYKCVTQ